MRGSAHTAIQGSVKDRQSGSEGCRRAFTLIEVMIVVILLGIAGALVIPSMSQTGVLRIQAAVRTIVADITFMQGEAVAYQGRRAMWFGKVAQWNAATSSWTFVNGNGYVLAEINGPTLNLNVDYMIEPGKLGRPYFRNFDDDRFGGAVLSAANFDGNALLIFDELGGPVANLTGPIPSIGGSVTITGSGAMFVLQVEPYTGRVTVTKTADISH